MDLEMPGSGGANDRAIIQAVQEGSLKEETLDLAVERILNIVYRYTENRRNEEFSVKKIIRRQLRSQDSVLFC